MQGRKMRHLIFGIGTPSIILLSVPIVAASLLMIVLFSPLWVTLALKHKSKSVVE